MTAEFYDFPTTDSAAPNADPNNLISVNQIVRVPALTYALDSNSSPSVADASIVETESGPELQITPLLPGQTEIGFTVTDIDGNELPATHTVTVQNSYPVWIAGEDIAPKPEGLTDNPGGGSFNNLQSYAFGGDADDASDDGSRDPQPTTSEIETVTHDALCFYHRKFVSDLVYTVQCSSDLSSWDTIWTSSDGNAADNVVSVEDDGEFWKLTVRKDTPASEDQIVLFRVSVTHPGLDG